mmetsp:Transcript_19402/g.46869  ORF Transcript_19402/g.46869 Transcript_19402/m.46869 type:complete len:408 (-) Transcript_19402:711-1934(-)
MHGAPLSKRDVEDVWNRVQPDSLVIELCEERFESMYADMMAAEEGERQGARWAVKRSGRVAVTAFQRLNVFSAFFAVVLNVIYLFQRLMKFDPGVEFKSAIGLAKRDDVLIYLGDQDVRSTINITQPLRVETFFRALRNSLEDVPMFGRSIVGYPNQRNGQYFNLLSWPLFDLRVFRDLGGLLFPVLMVFEAFVLLVHSGIGNTVPGDMWRAFSYIIESASFGSSFGFSLGDSAAMLGSMAKSSSWLIEDITSAFDIFLIPIIFSGFIRKIVIDRDAYLARSIRQACEDQLQKRQQAAFNPVDRLLSPFKPSAPARPPPTVVAVVGCLHINGIISRLIEDDMHVDVEKLRAFEKRKRLRLRLDDAIDSGSSSGLPRTRVIQLSKRKKKARRDRAVAAGTKTGMREAA